jgi:hypothetical protein
LFCKNAKKLDRGKTIETSSCINVRHKSSLFDTNMGWGFRVIFSFYALLEQMALLLLFSAILFGTFTVETE